MNRLASIALVVTAGCARTALNPECPIGYTHDGEKCVCATDQGCPRGMSCEQGSCVCRSSECCPQGYLYSSESERCVCRDQACCPADHLWVEKEQRCACGDQDCCPQGYQFDTDAGACQCAGDGCCPQGFRFDLEKGSCQCVSDGCCPFFVQTDAGVGNYRYDSAKKDCVCASDECCPENYKYSQAVKACVCVGDSCCPDGYRKDPERERCICVPGRCGTGRECDTVSGSCRCTSNAGCRPGTYCNAMGFCQSITACTSNLDCPLGTFCDVTANSCIPLGPCTLDEHCPLGNLCNSSLASCRAGCRRDGDCASKEACVNGLCLSYCRANPSCPANQFCDAAGGSCAFRSNRVDCADCSGNPMACGSAGNASCLAFIAEGQLRRFCGMHCTAPADCPSGFDCGTVIYTCGGAGSACGSDPDAPNETITCKGFLVENEQGTKYYCADSTGEPHEYFRACAPSSGYCPATAPP